MRLLGILFMSIALTGMGFLLAERRKERLQILIQLRQMVHYLKSQILYSNAALPDAVCEVGEHFENLEIGWSPASFFLNVGRLLEEKREQPFSAIWESAAEEIPLGVSLSKRDRESLGSLGGKLGYADRKMQERTLLFYQEQLDETIKEVKEEVVNLGKLYRTLGVAAGIFWFVLFI